MKVRLITGLLCTIAFMPLAAQQSTAPARASTPVTSTTAGPRLAPALPRFEPSISTNGSSYSAARDLNDSHTITMTTLGIILGAALLILLIV